MTGRRAEKRQRTAVAVSLSVAGHAAIVALIAFDLDRKSVAPAVPPTVEVSLAPLKRPIEQDKPRALPDLTSPLARRPAVAVTPLPPALAGPVQAPVAPLAGPAPVPVDESPAALRTGCVGRRGLDTKARVDCKLEVWTFLDGKPPKEIPGDAIPDDKQEGYDTVARQQARGRRMVYPGGNSSTIGCPHGNLGAGCLDEMLIPLTGSAAKK